jgi:hypothetical protein
MAIRIKRPRVYINDFNGFTPGMTEVRTRFHRNCTINI